MEHLTEKEKKVLDVDVRRKIYQVVRKNAGSHFREVQRRSGLSTGSCQYHLDYLCRTKLLKMEKIGQNIRYYPSEFSTDDTVLLGLLRDRSVRRILLYVMENLNCTHEQIMSDVGLSASTVTFHLKKLLDKSVISSKKEGRKSFHTLTADRETLMNLLITYQETFFDAIVDNIVEMWDST